MTEQKVKKRDWVKNAAIIFLAVMLVLTFFSNTIMNHSLPEVAAQYVQSGAISAKIRGTGTVTANESYEVKTEQAREVLSVPVKVGDKVSEGDTLVLFTDAESDSMKTAQDALDGLILAYKKALLNANDPDYAKQNRDIEYAQKTLDKAKAKRDEAAYSAADFAQAKQNVTNAQSAVTNAKAKVDSAANAVNTAQNNLDAIGDLKPSTTGDDSAIRTAQIALNASTKNRDALKLAYEEAYNQLIEAAKGRYGTKSDYATNKAVYEAALAEEYSNSDNTDNKKYASGYNKIVEAEAAVTSAQTALTNAQNDYWQHTTSGNEAEYNRLKKLVTDAQKVKDAADKAKLAADEAKAAADEKYVDFKAKKEAYDAAVSEVETAQKALQDQLFALADQKKTDGKTQAGAALDLADQRRQIQEKQNDITKLKENGDGSVLKSKVNGIVANVSVTAGKNADAGAVLMSVEVPDMGYGVQLSVTKEQAKKLKVGDKAEVTTNNWNDKPMTATLSAIKTDPAKPGENKLLEFKIEGEDIESGAQLSLAIGARGGNYDAIVPTSAVRSDNNGSFVLVVVSKSSPLGNRYVAQRVDVKVVASDDTNSAVSGGLTTSDFVITTSNKPIEPGKLVRLPDQAS